jgi:AcrR family transcriptional regulator
VDDRGGYAAVGGAGVAVDLDLDLDLEDRKTTDEESSEDARRGAFTVYIHRELMSPPRKRTRPRTRSPLPLSRDRIARAALELIDSQGLEDFSTRKLGAYIGCEAMAFYNHFPSKDALLDAVVEQMVAKVAIPSKDSGTWVERARAFARSFRALARVHPRAFPLIATRRFNAPGTLALLETAYGTFLDEGFEPLNAVKIYRTLGNFLAGTALNEIAVASFAASTSATHAGDPALVHLAAVFPYLSPAYFDEVFEFGLEVVLDGCQRLAAKKRSP